MLKGVINIDKHLLPPPVSNVWARADFSALFKFFLLFHKFNHKSRSDN
jgi:hypothetical protein